MTQPSALEAYAISILTPYVKRGDDLDAFLRTGHSGITPAREDQPSMHFTCGGTLYLTKDGNGASLRIKRSEIGVIFHFADGHSECNVFDIRSLWDVIKNPQQLELWPELRLVK